MTVLAALAVLTTTGCDPTTALPTPAAGAAVGPAGSRRVAVARCRSRPEDATAPYDRDEWGDWASHGHGCNTREIVLTEQGHGERPGAELPPGVPDVRSRRAGRVPYDGARIRDARRVQIDHRVPLGEAARSGAAGWTRAQRERFYNDRTNLVAASVHSNTSKGDDDPARWRPADRAAWCGYATAYVTTKHTYGLSVDRAERDALAAMLATCGGGA